MTHTHEPSIGLDRLIKCRICGKILPGMTETISTVQSECRAIRIMSEIAVAGSYIATEFRDGLIVFSRNTDGLVEEISAIRVHSKLYRVMKTTRVKEVESA